MDDPYQGREQTKAKHIILKGYLQALAFKILSRRNEIAYIDGFSGPWEEQTQDFSDTSFGIAIKVLKDAQEYFRKKGQTKKIRCCFVEKNRGAYRKLLAAVGPFHSIERGFEIRTFENEFEQAVPDIVRFVDKSFALVFIDPTGWTGYAYEDIRPLLRHTPGEVLINFMYDFANRAAAMRVPETERSLDPILGGPGWPDRLDAALPRGEAIEKLFREELERAGGYEFVISACIKRATADRTHFFIAYGTRKDSGLLAFRQVEWNALRQYEQLRVVAKLDKRKARTGVGDLFGLEDLPGDRTIYEEVKVEKAIAKEEIPQFIASHGGQMSFRTVRNEMMRRYRLRETDLKKICAELGKEGVVEETWKDASSRRRTPDVQDIIRLLRK